LPEGKATHTKDSGGNIQPLDRDLTSMTFDEGTSKTTPHPEGSLGDKDSGGNIPPTDMEPIHTIVADLSGTGVKYQRHIREPIWYMDNGCSRSMTGVKSYLHKFIEQPGPKAPFGDSDDMSRT
nr:retrovirus-related Pol polyprotein from transposon TNT 1-94 [Tanacetum cinerariifolium]